MRWYQTLGLSIGLIAGCQHRDPTIDALALAQLARNEGENERSVEGEILSENYLLRKTVKIKDYDTDIEVRVLDCVTENQGRGGLNGRMEIRVTPRVPDPKSHMPFGYEITDWGCDGMREEGDDFRLYLGRDRWHHSRGAAIKSNSPMDVVVVAGVPRMYDALVKTLYRVLQ